MALAQPKPGPEREYYTYKDSLDWDEDERWELFDGVLNGDARMRQDPKTGVWMMASASVNHQTIARELILQFGAFLRGKPCQLLPEITVRPFPQPDDNDKTFFVPDLVVVCDKAQLTAQACLGAPALVIEILSPSTASNDLVYKLNKYRQAGVREYWVVDPVKKLVNVFLLAGDGSHYLTTTYSPDDTPALAVSVLPGCVIDLRAVFA